MVNQLPAQLSCQTCGNFAAAAAILAGNRHGLHSCNGLLIHFHGCTSAVSIEEIKCEAVLCLQASHGDSPDNMALRKNIDYQQGEDRDNRAGHHQCPLRSILSAELVEHQRHGKRSEEHTSESSH